MFRDRRDDDHVVGAGLAGVVHANRDLRLGSRDGVLAGFDADAGQGVGELRLAARDQAYDVGADRGQFERGDGSLQFDRRSVFDRAGDAVRYFDASLVARRDVADVRAAARDQRRVAEFVVEVAAVELPRADQVDEPFRKIEADANAGGDRAALVAERERRTHRHSRFQLAVGRNDERSEPLRQRWCTRCENFRQRAHRRWGFAARERPP